MGDSMKEASAEKELLVGGGGRTLSSCKVVVDNLLPLLCIVSYTRYVLLLLLLPTTLILHMCQPMAAFVQQLPLHGSLDDASQLLPLHVQVVLCQDRGQVQYSLLWQHSLDQLFRVSAQSRSY